MSSETIDKELDELFNNDGDITDVGAGIMQAIIDDRRRTYRQQMAALKIDYHVAKVLEDDQQMTNIRDAGKKVLKAIEALDEFAY